MPIFAQSKLGMQLKHPEILWALFLLLIPILIHLFQLRRFKKTAFTNVAMLQKVVIESRKSNTIKKWLLLATRLLLLAALVMAFAQPFSSKKSALKEKETVIYLDNSFSMQAKTNGMSILEKSVQDLIKNIDEGHVFTLFTNERTYTDITIKDIQNNLLSLPFSHLQLSLDEIHLKANTLFSDTESVIKNLVLISDFQQRMRQENTINDTGIQTYFVPVGAKQINNVSIDSLSLGKTTGDQTTLFAYLSGKSQNGNIPISLFNGKRLIAKTAAEFKSDSKALVEFSIPGNEIINGHLTITDTGLSYDNHFYFNIDKKPPIKVLAISNGIGDYLDRLFPEGEFIFKKFRLNELDYSTLDGQHLVILDNLESIPNSLQKILGSFKKDGGTLILVPAEELDLPSYNQFVSGFFSTRFLEKIPITKQVTTITFEHPIYREVFEKKVSNFQYPNTKSFFKIQTRAPKMLSLEGGDTFLSGDDGFYFFSASLENENSNFVNSPLIVPTFYNMASFSLKLASPYLFLGIPNSIDVTGDLENDKVIKVAKDGYEFIPLQRTFPNKVSLTFDENPTVAGIFNVLGGQDSLQHISFNYPREESKLDYLDVTNLANMGTHDSIPSLFQFLESENSITAYWKWFVILALLLFLVEVIIQKFIR